MTALVVLVFAAPIAAGAVGVLLRHHRRVQRTLAYGTFLGLIVASVRLLGETLGGRTVTVDVGGFPAGLAIVLGVDALSALMLVLGSTMTLLGVVFAASTDEDQHPLFQPLVQFLWAGVALAFVTADLFNLFVAFEIMLIASYVLLTLRRGSEQVRAGTIYVATNLLASTIFLVGIAIVYGAIGTVNLAAVGGAVPGDAGATAGLAVLLVAIVAKAGLVPLHGWLPRTYVHASPAVTAIFSALLTKVGVYVLYRLTSIALGDVSAAAPILLILAATTMVVGVLGAVGGHDMRGILTFHMVSQVGYLVLPLGMWTRAAVTAGLLYLVQYVAVKGALLFTAAAVTRTEGTDDLGQLGGLLRSRRWLAIAFLLPALSLAGLPPTSGFVGKYLLIRAAFADGELMAASIAVGVSFLTLMSMIKIFSNVFWGAADSTATRQSGAPVQTRPKASIMTALPLSIGVLAVLVGPFAAVLLGVTDAVAASLLDPSAYFTAVSR